MIVKATKYGKIWIQTLIKELPQSVRAVPTEVNSFASNET